MTYEHQISKESQVDNNPNEDYRDSQNNRPAERTNGNDTARYWGMDERTFSMLLHLSSFMSMAVPIAGIILPIVMWATNKNDSQIIDAHGKNVINWMISLIIYLIVSGFLCLILIGIPILLALFICSIVFTIMGAVKANNGQVWKYPMSIRFFK
jgi:hypothetical protein